MEPAKKERIGWYFYDWANSAFITSVVTVFIGPYLTTIAQNAADKAGNLDILGISVFNGSYFAYLVSLSVILQVFLLPILGAIADKSNLKKHLLGIFAYIGSITTMCMFFLEGNKYLLGGFLFVVSNLCFGASVVMYNAYLNDIAESEKRDSVSSIGWAIGYIGGGILLALNLVLFSMKEKFGISIGMAVRINLCSAGVWWAIFTLIPMFTLKIRESANKETINSSFLRSSFTQLIGTIKDSFNYPQTMLFLIAYLLYNDGVQAVITLSAQFGQQEMGFSMSTLTTVILMVQFVAFFGSLFFAFIAKKSNSKIAILITLFIWILIILYTYGFLKTEFQFYILAAVIALVLGGSQALSRSLYSMVIPKGKEAEYFSLYEVSDKGTSWMGPLLFGISLQLTKSYRLGILSLGVFFVIGVILLLLFKMKVAIAKVNEV